jgi:polyphosphate kinase
MLCNVCGLLNIQKLLRWELLQDCEFESRLLLRRSSGILCNTYLLSLCSRRATTMASNARPKHPQDDHLNKRNGDSASASELPLVGAPPALSEPSLYANRELSLLAFQRRVLEEAQDSSNPLLERVKFLSIVGSNLDEFFMVRVAGVRRQFEAGIQDVGPDGMSPAEQIDSIRAEVNSLVTNASRCYRRLEPELEDAGIKIHHFADLNAKQKYRALRYYSQTVFPVLTPLAFDPGRPFPHISNLSVNLAVTIRDSAGEIRFARVKVPSSLPQLVAVDPIPRKRGRRKFAPQTFVWIDDLIQSNLKTLFPGMRIDEAYPFHVTRDADFEIQELEAADLLETTEEGLRQRKFGDVVRLVVDHDMPLSMLRILMRNLDVTRGDVYRVRGPLSLSRLKHVAAIDAPQHKYAPFVPSVPTVLEYDPKEEDIFSVIRRKDVLLHHPFNSFKPVIDLLQASAEDERVLAIKMTLYRVGQNSPVVKTLLDAVENEKQVATLVELKARFDEDSNIEWARALEDRGVHVVYGLIGLKVHSKITLIVRNEGGEIQRYLHLGTGNYNPITAHLYTDIGLLTTDEDLAADATEFFNYLTGYSEQKEYRKLLVAPINLRQRLAALIEREIAHHNQHGGGHLIFKMNALVDSEMIRLLYRASQAGVQVDLLVRGICCLRPGIAGVSDNIRVISIVGRFLEHSRIFYFRNNGEDQIFVGSADLMPRNLDRRVEVIFPVEEHRLIRFLRDDVLGLYLADNVKARVMQSDGSYARKPRKRTDPLLNSQRELLNRYRVGGER